MPFGSTRPVFFKRDSSTYLVSPSITSVDEGSTVTFNVLTTGVLDGTTLYWTAEGTNITAADFTANALSGSFVINSGSGSVTLTMSNDLSTEGPESFVMNIRINSISGTVVASSGSVLINDTSVTPLPTWANGGFELNSLSGWTAYNQQISPGGIIAGKLSTLATCPVPADPTNAVSSTNGASPGQSPTFTGGFTTAVVTPGYTGATGTRCAKMTIVNGNVASPGQMIYGPALVTNAAATVGVGDRISFYWTAQGGGDAFNVLAYAVSPNNSCQSIILLDSTGTSASATVPWTQVNRVFQAGEAGDYYFVFVCGAFDYTFGGILGTIVSIDRVQVDRAGTF